MSLVTHTGRDNVPSGSNTDSVPGCDFRRNRAPVWRYPEGAYRPICPNAPWYALHFAVNRAVEDAGVVAGHFRIGVAEHLGYALHRHSVSQHTGCKSVAGSVGADLFADAAYISQFLQINVHLLPPEYGQQYAVSLTIGSRFVFVQYL